MQRSRQLLDMALLILLVSLVIFDLVHGNVGGLYRIDGEKIENVIIILNHSHGE